MPRLVKKIANNEAIRQDRKLQFAEESDAYCQEVVYWSVVEQAKAIKEGEFTSRELLELTIKQI